MRARRPGWRTRLVTDRKANYVKIARRGSSLNVSLHPARCISRGLYPPLLQGVLSIPDTCFGTDSLSAAPTPHQLTQALASRYHQGVPEHYKQNQTKQIRGVIFDLDGTLVHTHIDFGDMKRRVIGHCVDRGVFREDFRHLDILALVERAVHLMEPALQETARQELWDLLEAIEMEYIADAYLPDDTAELLEELDGAGMAMAVATRNCERAAHQLLSKLPKVFRKVIARENALKMKPHPGHLLQASDSLGIPPDQIAMVGDHAMDIRAAKAAGMLAIGVLHGVEEENFGEFTPDILCHNMKELRDALLGTNS